MDLRPTETRVLGCLIEKQRTTPDAYPLTLNSLRLACNQATNREPVVDYDEQTVRDALHRLERRGFARMASGAGSRSSKFRHLLSERLPMDDSEQAVMCVLMLRGTQTPGELKQRTERLHPLDSLEAVHAALDRLMERDLVARLDRRPGQKEERYHELLTASDDDDEVAAPRPEAAGQTPSPGPPQTHLQQAAETSHAQELERRVARLERQMAELLAAQNR
jgi:uncharacterized protein YceH (UPF0502 family)